MDAEAADAGADGLHGGGAHWGVAYWSQGADARIFSTRAQYLFALDAKTGEPIADFGDGGKVDLNVGLGPLMKSFRWSGVPLIARDVVVIGSSMLEQDSARTKEGPPGDVRAYDIHTGKLRWTFHVIPHAGEPGVETWENESYAYTGAGNVWSMMSADDELGYVYLPTSSGTNDMYGGHRLGNNLYTSSIVCLDAKTGKRIWHFQTVHHDLFDYDNPAAPILADITVNGRRDQGGRRRSPSRVSSSCSTGRPASPCGRSKNVPFLQSTVPGEKASPTQPIPTKPPPFEHQGLQDDDLIDFTPQLRAEALEIIKQYVTGPLYHAAVDTRRRPRRHEGHAAAARARMAAPRGPARRSIRKRACSTSRRRRTRSRRICSRAIPRKPTCATAPRSRALVAGPRGLPLTKPPYGRVTAIDLNNGERAWMVANGDGPRNHPEIKALNLPPLGQAVRSSAIATKTLLFVTEGDQNNPRTPPGGGGRKFRALDKATGKTLWEIEFEAGAKGAPMTYVHQGKQYVVLAIGGNQHPGEFVALSLP